jgi:hypothetical protein
MNMLNIAEFSPLQRQASDLCYETDLKAVLDPILTDLLDQTKAAGWDRRKAAYAIMVLAAQKFLQQDVKMDDSGLTDWQRVVSPGTH